jgi:hypothetical protein
MQQGDSRFHVKRDSAWLQPSSLRCRKPLPGLVKGRISVEVTGSTCDFRPFRPVQPEIGASDNDVGSAAELARKWHDHRLPPPFRVEDRHRYCGGSRVGHCAARRSCDVSTVAIGNGGASARDARAAGTARLRLLAVRHIVAMQAMAGRA